MWPEIFGTTLVFGHYAKHLVMVLHCLQLFRYYAALITIDIELPNY